MNPDWRIGQFLALQRKSCGFASQADFAKCLGVSRFHLANIESGRTPLLMEVAWKACRELKLHPGFLITNGAAFRLPFEVLNAEAVKRADALIKAKCTARFIDLWPALYELFFMATEIPQISPKRQYEVMLDNNAALSDDSGVKEIRSLPVLLDEIRKLTKDRGGKIALANKMKVTRQAVDQWLSGATKPTAEMTFELIAWVKDQHKRTK